MRQSIREKLQRQHDDEMGQIVAHYNIILKKMIARICELEKQLNECEQGESKETVQGGEGDGLDLSKVCYMRDTPAG